MRRAPPLAGIALAVAACADEPTGPEVLWNVALACAQSFSVSGGAAPETLLRPTMEGDLSQEQQSRLELVRQRPTSYDVSLARESDGADSLMASARTLVVELRPNVAFRLVADTVWATTNFRVWGGNVVGASGSASLIYTQLLQGSINAIPRDGMPVLYRMEPLGGGLLAIVCEDWTKIPPD